MKFKLYCSWILTSYIIHLHETKPILMIHTRLFKNIFPLSFLLVFSFCSTPEQSVTKYWQGQSVNFNDLKEVTNTYHMLDSTNTKVGSMVFGFSFENGYLVARDTSLFDDGSVYETAELIFDTTDFYMKAVSIDIKMPGATLDVQLNSENKRITGAYEIKRDTTTNTNQIDSIYQFSVFREEIYMLTHTLNLEYGDTISLNVFAPTNLSISKAQMIYSGEESIETLHGTQSCDVIWLKADGKMPDNKIWVSKTSPRTIMKFFVPGPQLSIELVSQR